ncbi:MAG TPA: toll/interleukin-1 receptor domain-containing protein [Albitalea sp.]|uniref:toll/interleukin-1 receptor domain-containing protein n=1 Tax=Piscinibacter sp. TaxID=1903157 RepID=UPI002ED52066
MSDTWQNDVFISYSHDDREWAQRLVDALRTQKPQRRIFYDHESLRAGGDWHGHIDTALGASQHLIVLWSDQAQLSPWVSLELGQFWAFAKPLANPGRRMIFVNLQGENRAFTALQHVNQPQVKAAYLDAAKFSQADWDLAMQDVEYGLDPTRRPLVAPVAVLTLTADDLADETPAKRNALAVEFGLTEAELTARYGASRTDWRPFDGSKTLAELLECLRTELSQGLPGLDLRWRMPADAFWTDIDRAQDFVKQEFLPAELSLLVIDPVAMHNHEVYQRLMLFQECLERSRTTIVTLPPFGVPPHVLSLRSALMKRTKPYFDLYFKPVVPPPRPLAAHCGWNVGDADEVRRLILAAAGALVPAPAPVVGGEFVAQRARRP